MDDILFSAIAGDAYEVSASDLQEAEKKLEAYLENRECMCKSDDCSCVTPGGPETAWGVYDGK